MRRRLLLGFLIGFVTVFGISCKVLPGEKQDIYSDTGIKLNRSSFFPIATDRGKALSSFKMEAVLKYHTRTFNMQDFIGETNAMFNQAWLSEYTPFRLEIALRKYDM